MLALLVPGVKMGGGQASSGGGSVGPNSNNAVIGTPVLGDGSGVTIGMGF